MAHQAAVQAGQRRPPRPDEVHELAPGDEGTVGELLRVDPGVGPVYVIHWDVGSEIETELPSPAVALAHNAEPAVDQAPETPTPRRYATTSPGLRARVRAAITRATGTNAPDRAH